MEKIFEDYFSELQADMISIGMEYVDGRADEIFVYCVSEPGIIAFNMFFRINGKLVFANQLNSAMNEGVEGGAYDVSEERQDAMMDVGIKDLLEIEKKCEEYNERMPTEMKLRYDVRANKLTATYRYDVVHPDDGDTLPFHTFHAWFNEMASS